MMNYGGIGMTEKRFTVEKLELVSDHLSTRFFIKDNKEDKYYDVHHIVSEGFEVQYESWADKIAEKMNELNDKIELIEIDKRNLHHLDAHNRIKILELRKENHELQERNNRQYKQLGDLYRLIEEKDWRALSDIMDDFKKSEELLQKEWSNFG